ncbi:MAG: hypothetical protein NTY53_06560 [Kiritimatiellaeota bacterium]|nr:hypothetical protein [Kiritimatiellota bacterium]
MKSLIPFTALLLAALAGWGCCATKRCTGPDDYDITSDWFVVLWGA